jgi:DNA-binding CsgD family transcriptional regulator
MKPQTISPREGQVIFELMNGNVVKEVADNLCISFNTADTHIKNAKRRTGAKNIAELVFIFLKQNKDLLAMLLVMFQIFITFQNPEIELRRTKTASRIVKTAKKNKR